MAVVVFGYGHCKTLKILEGSMATLWAEIIWPRYSIEVLPKLHFFLLAKNWWRKKVVRLSEGAPNEILDWDYKLKYHKKKTSTKRRRYGRNTSFIIDWKVARAFIRLMGITKNSQWLECIQKVVLWTSSKTTWIWWYPEIKSNFEKYRAPCSSSNISCITEMGYLSGIVALFNWR